VPAGNGRKPGVPQPCGEAPESFLGHVIFVARASRYARDALHGATTTDWRPFREGGEGKIVRARQQHKWLLF